MNAFESLANQFDLTLIILFGSRAKGQTGPMSDTDILVAPARELSAKEAGALRAALAENFSVQEETLDLVILHHATPLVRSEALETGKILFGRIDVFTQERVRAWKMLLDNKKFIRLRHDFLSNALLPKST